MDILRLRSFVMVARLGHLTRAAERLFLTQPAVTAHIKAIEQELGVTLFDRAPGRLEPEGMGMMDVDRGHASSA